jgi:hypothetical protein
MGNCTGYCTACQPDGAGKYDNNQVRNSIRDKDMLLNEGFGDQHSGSQQEKNLR